MKMKHWYQKLNRMSDLKASTRTNRASYHPREPNEDDDERLAMRKGNMPPPVPERVANPRRPSSTGIPTVPPPKTPTQRHGLTVAEVSSHNPCGKQAQTLIPITCQRISATSSSTTWVPSTGRVNFWKLRMLISRFLQMKRSTLPTILTCRFSQNLREQLRACDLDGRG